MVGDAILAMDDVTSRDCARVFDGVVTNSLISEQTDLVDISMV